MDKLNLHLESSLSGTTQQSRKYILPISIIRLEGKGEAVHFLEVVGNNAEGEPGERSKFAVFTREGSVMVYDTMFRRVKWMQQTNIDGILWGTISSVVDGHDLIIFYGRIHGVQIVPQLQEQDPDDAESIAQPRPVLYPVHVGFCKPVLCSDEELLIPSAMNRLAVIRFRDELQYLHVVYEFPESVTLMAMKEIHRVAGSIFVLCSTDDGVISVVEVKLNKNPYEGILVGSHLLPKYGDEVQPLGICIEGLGNTYVVGTNTKYIFKYQWENDSDLENPVQHLVPCGNKVLPASGVSCMTVRKTGGILAAGCFDGTVRLFNFPDMHQISTINYYKSRINALMFINEGRANANRWFLLCSSDESSISVWNI